MSKNNLIIAVVFTALAIAGAAWWFFMPENNESAPVDTSLQEVTGQKIAKPAERPSAPPTGADKFIELKNTALKREMPTEEIKALSSALEREPDYPKGWLQLGILRKFAGDYEGASLSWQYASVMRPADYIALNNLGDLYHYYLKDFQKAENYMRQAVAAKPDFISGYKNLHDLYVFSLKEKSALADDVLLEGIKNNPKDYYLRTILASYYKDQGQKDLARKYYEEALLLNPPNKAAIEEELKNL